jgi:hypothetical protein
MLIAPTFSIDAPSAPLAQPKPTTQRDQRIDFWRGICIVGMVSWHLFTHPSYPRALAFLVIQSINFAAEGFVLLAGVSIGYQLHKSPDRIRRAGPHLARAVRFLALHYVMASCITFVIVTTGLFGSLPTRTAAQWARDIAWLQFQPYLGDVLTVFIFLFALTPLLLAMQRWGGDAALAVLSLVVFAVSVVAPDFAALNAHGAFVVNGWQVYFVLGILFGLHYQRVLEAWRRRPGYYLTLNLIVCGLLMGWRLMVELDPDLAARAPLALRFERHPLTLARVLDMVAQMHLLALATTLVWRWIADWRPTAWLVLMGRHSLEIFVVSVALDYLLKGLFNYYGWGPPLNILCWPVLLVVLYQLARLLAWRATKQTA